MDFLISKYGTNYTSESDTVQIVENILSFLSSNDTIIIDLQNVNLMTTTAAKSILKPIALKYGYNNIFKKLFFKNVNEDLKTVLGIAFDGIAAEIKVSND